MSTANEVIEAIIETKVKLTSQDEESEPDELIDLFSKPSANAEVSSCEKKNEDQREIEEDKENAKVPLNSQDCAEDKIENEPKEDLDSSSAETVSSTEPSGSTANSEKFDNESSTVSPTESDHIASEDNDSNSSAQVTTTHEEKDLQTEKRGDRYEYTKDQLIAISKTAHARKRPQCLDVAFNGKNGLWDPEKWLSSKIPNYSGTKITYQKKERFEESADNGPIPRKSNVEKIIEQSKDDIVLSPQRRSFGTGCHVSATAKMSNKTTGDKPRANRDSLNADVNNRDDDRFVDSSQRNVSNSRKVGTGRVLNRERDRDWGNFDREQRPFDKRRDYRDWNRLDRDRDRDDFEGRRNRGVNNRNYEDNRRSFNRDSRYDSHSERSENHRNHRKFEDEPEWFTGGPTSQSETIELRGFDDPIPSEKVPNEKSKTSCAGEDSENKIIRQNNEEEVKNEERSSGPQANQGAVQEVKGAENRNDEMGFDVNAMFDANEWMNGFVGNDKQMPFIPTVEDIEANNHPQSGSRFKQWFKVNEEEENRLKSSQSEREKLNDAKTFKEASNLKIQTQSAFERSQLPPLRQNQQGPHCQNADGKNILDLFQKAKINVNQIINQQAQAQPKIDITKMKSVAELEADFKQTSMPNNVQQNNGISPFEKLFSQLANKPQNTGFGNSDGISRPYNIMDSPVQNQTLRDSHLANVQSYRQSCNTPPFELLKHQPQNHFDNNTPTNVGRLFSPVTILQNVPRAVQKSQSPNQMKMSGQFPHNFSHMSPVVQNTAPQNMARISSQDATPHTQILHNALRQQQIQQQLHHQQMQHMQDQETIMALEFAKVVAQELANEKKAKQPVSKSIYSNLMPTSVIRQAVTAEKDTSTRLHSGQNLGDDIFKQDLKTTSTMGPRPITKLSNNLQPQTGNGKFWESNFSSLSASEVDPRVQEQMIHLLQQQQQMQSHQRQMNMMPNMLTSSSNNASASTTSASFNNSQMPRENASNMRAMNPMQMQFPPMALKQQGINIDNIYRQVPRNFPNQK